MNIVFKTSDNVKEKMINYYQDKRKEKTPPYAIFQAQEADSVITLYESGKVMFQGVSADIDANMWIDMEKHLNNRDINIEEKEKKDHRYHNISAIGSDEVGTGDYLLPIVVTAAFVDKKEIPFLEALKVTDSKKITDDLIRAIAPKIMKEIPYDSVVLTNKEYNDLKTFDCNMNKVKAILHNRVLVNMVNKGFNYDRVIIDQFTSPRFYFNYLKDTKIKITKLLFLTKAESKNMSVACASIISRYIFLMETEKLEEKYKMTIPKGAGKEVDKVAKELVKKHGEKILNEISKISFKNTEKVLEKK